MDLFSPERACLPLTLTGNGALTSDDVLSLEGGFPAILPDPRVMFVDRRLKLPHIARENQWRGLFYITHKLAELHEQNQAEGCIILYLVITPRLNDIDPVFVSRSTASVRG